MKNDIPIFIPSYHRPTNIKTAYYFIKRGWEATSIHVVIDNEADDKAEYEEEAQKWGFNLHVFDMEECRERYDYVHRASKARRSAGQARNMFYDIAIGLGIDFYIVIDDDTSGFEMRPFGIHARQGGISDVRYAYEAIKAIMQKRHIGLFGLPQSGDIYSSQIDTQTLRYKVMNTTFVNVPYIYRGERGVQDNDTSQFVAVMNEGYFTGSLRTGLILHQQPSAKQSGGLTDLYNECKLLNKSLVCVIQYPSAIRAERQKMNGGRLHHRINYRYLMPKIIKGERSNIEWDAYPEDVPFTNEPKRAKTWERKQC